MKQSQPQKSPSNREQSNTIHTQYGSVDNYFTNDNNPNEQYYNQILRMLHQRQEFQESEYKLKVKSLEKRIKSLIQISSQLTQQNTQIKLQFQDLLKQNDLLREKLEEDENLIKQKNIEYQQQIDECNKLKQERERLIGLTNKYHERSKIRKKELQNANNTIQIQSRNINDLQKENLLLVSEKQNLLLQLQQKNNNFINQQQSFSQDELNKTSQIDFQSKNEIQQIIKRFLNDFNNHLNQINQETIFLFSFIKEQYDLDGQNQIKYNKLIKLFETLINNYNQMLQLQIKFQYKFNVSTQDFYQQNNEIIISKRSSSNNIKQEIITTSKLIKLQQINIFLSQIIEQYIIHTIRVRILINQILYSDEQNNNQKYLFKKIVYVILAIIRLTKRKKFYNYRLLIIDLPIEETFHQLLGIINTQQQLIEKYQE